MQNDNVKFKKAKKNGSILTIILIVIFSMAGGVVGDLFFRGYFWQDIFNLTPLGEINLLRSDYGGPSLIIRSANHPAGHTENYY